MNMISTGSFLTETGASNKQSELVKKLTAAWEKKNSKTARAGGASLMALSLAACGGEDNTPFSQADVDAALTDAAGTKYDTVDAAIVSDNTDVMMTQADYDAAIATATTSNDADIKTEALTSADGTIYATVDAAYSAGSNVTNAAAVETALTDASGVKHNNVDAAITSNDATVEADATAAAEATLVAGSGFSSVADLLAAYTAAVAPEGAATPALTTSRDIPSMTGSDDSASAAYNTLGATDIISDASSTDSDTLTAVFDLNSATTFTAVNIETINLDIRSATNTTLDLVNVSGTDTVNLYTNYGYNPAALTVDNISTGTTIDVATSIVLGASETLTLAVNEDEHTSAVTLNMNGDSFTLATQNAATDDIDLLTINSGGSAANTVTLSGANAFAYAATNANSITLTGDQNMTIKVTDTTLDSDGLYIIDSTTAGTTTLEVTEAAVAGASNDLSNAGVDVISIKGAVNAGDAFVVASGARIDLDSDYGNGQAVDMDISTTASNSSVTVNLDVTSSGAANNAHLTLGEFNTVNFGNTSAAATVLDGNLAMSVGGIGEEIDLNIATGEGLTITGTTAASSGTLDAVTISGDGAFVQTGAMTASTVNAATGGDVTFTAALTGDTTVDIAARKTLNIDNGISGSFTLTGAGDADIESTVGESSGVISITTTGSTDIQGAVTGALTAAISANETLNLQGATSGDVNLSGAGDFAVGGLTTGDVTSTLTGELDFAAITGDSNFTLTANTGTVDELDVSGDITGSIVLSGSGDADLDGDISGDLTVGGSVTVAHAATKIVSGTLTATGSGDISTEIDGAVVAGTASGDITTTGSGTQTGTIVTGSGDDSITIANGDNPVSISSGDGNDTIDANLGAAAIAIDGGAGNDTITGTNATSDEITGGFGTDTFKFIDDDESGFSEVIKDFAVGSAGDILHFTAAGIDAFGTNMTSTTFTKVDTTDSTATTFADTQLVVLTATTYADVAAVVAALNGSSGLNGNVGTDDAIVTVFADTDGHSYVTLLEGDGSNDFSATDGEIVKLEGLGVADLAAMTADNFTIA